MGKKKRHKKRIKPVKEVVVFSSHRDSFALGNKHHGNTSGFERMKYGIVGPY